MAYLSKRGGFWYVRGVIRMPDGSRYEINRESTHVKVDEPDSRKHAEAAMKRIIAQIRSGKRAKKDGDVEKATVADGVRKFLNQKSLATTSTQIVNAWANVAGSTLLRDLTIGQIDGYVEAQSWAPVTRRRVLQTIQSCLNHLRDKDYPVPPLKFTMPPPPAVIERRWMGPEEWRDFLPAAQELTPDAYPLFVFLRHTGCRTIEARKLLWDNIFTKPGKGGKPVLYATLTSNKGRNGQVRTRSIKLARPVLEALPEKPKRWRGQPVFLCQGEGRYAGKEMPFTYMQFKKRWDRVRDHVGLDKDVTPYSARHGFASVLMQKGQPDKLIADLMGHADTQMLNRYAHLRPEDYDSAVDLLAEDEWPVATWTAIAAE